MSSDSQGPADSDRISPLTSARARKTWKRLTFAARHPELIMRRLRGRSIIEIEMDEIRRLVPDARVIVEAGALDGRDTEQLAATWPNAVVHAFEPVPRSMVDVRARVGSLPNVALHVDALSDATGVAELFVSRAPDGSPLRDSSSLLRPHDDMSLLPEVTFEAVPIHVPAITLDDWAARESVDRIDLAWLDLQGMELAVLRAAPRAVSGFSAVCMEVSRVELYEGQALYPEILSWMTANGFQPAIERMSYLFGNVLFVRTNR